jgi:hypothetical protein
MMQDYTVDGSTNSKEPPRQEDTKERKGVPNR